MVEFQGTRVRGAGINRGQEELEGEEEVEKEVEENRVEGQEETLS